MSAVALVLPPATPADYHRIVSPTLIVPTDPNIPIPVGLLACQRDPLLREMTSTVVSCRPSQALPPPKRAKKDKVVTTDPLIELILHDTLLFPEGGGQPSDVGTLTSSDGQPSDVGTLTSSDGQLWDVLEVKRHGGHAVHYVKVGSSTLEDALNAFAGGSTVGVALGEAGLYRRLDHMCMHTSQHLLSAVIESSLKLDTLSWSLTAWPTPSYVEIPHALTADEIASVQAECNRYVFEGRKVHVEVEELDSEFLQKYKSPSAGIPTDYTGGVKRIVVIDGIDRNPCCGTHSPSLNNLQLFLFPQTENLARASSSSARLYFLSGPRLITYLTSTHSHLSQTANTLSCGAAQVPERVAQVIDDRKQMTNRAEDVERELAGLLAKAMSDPGEDNVIMSYSHRTDDTPNSLSFLTSISSAFLTEITTLSQAPSYLIVLSSSPSSQGAATSTTLMVFGSDDKKVKAVGDVLKAKLGVKGGGKGTRWSGKFDGVWLENREGAVVRDILGACNK